MSNRANIEQSLKLIDKLIQALEKTQEENEKSNGDWMEIDNKQLYGCISLLLPLLTVTKDDLKIYSNY